jgi:hypothetical protein
VPSLFERKPRGLASTACGRPAIPQADTVDHVEEDWRVTVTLHDEPDTGRLRHALHEYEAEEKASDRLGGRLAVSGDADRLFLYSDTREAAREAERVVREILLAHDLDGDFAIDRWHPVEERWENERVPLPRTDAERKAEDEQLEEARSQNPRSSAWLSGRYESSWSPVTMLSSWLNGFKVRATRFYPAGPFPLYAAGSTS